ncbi:MAG: HAMP domain-containing histidine kinase [Acidobacteria bacterium]|nr:HAMP domain-containing histidine kinase [Acidobacteriota bacterium]
MKGKLRTKFLLSLALTSALLTWATLLFVRHRVLLHVREEIADSLRNSVVTFQSLQQRRESALQRSAALLASLPPLKAVMTSQHEATIQDASAEFWRLSDAELFLLADRSGKVVALHSSEPRFPRNDAQELLRHFLDKQETRDWWYGGGQLFEVAFQPIYFGSPTEGTPLGILAVGYKVDERLAEDVSRVSSSRVAFRYGPMLVVSTLSAAQQTELARHGEHSTASASIPGEIELDGERFLRMSVDLAPGESPPITLSVFRSFDQATAFLQSLNRWIVAIGLAAVLAGSILIYVISTTFTRPLADLVQGVHALQKGDYTYPLRVRGNDELSELTAAFQRMRDALQKSQHELLHAERLATIGRMASTISHDLRHPLTAILAYAEFLSEGNISSAQRQDFYQEIRLAVNRMNEEISSLLGFSRDPDASRPQLSSVRDAVERSIQTVHARPEFRGIAITYSGEDCDAWFDPHQLERVLNNLLFNACEAVRPDSGNILISARRTSSGIELRVADNGAGVPDAIRETLFQPFVSYGKESGTGLGLTVVYKTMQDLGGEVCVESTGPSGSVFKLTLPLRVPADQPT